MQVEVMDFEQRVRNKIRVEGSFPGFPQPERYNLEKSEIDDYLMDKQLALDSGGSARTQYTIMGVMIILPVSTKRNAWWQLGYFCCYSYRIGFGRTG